MSGLYPQVAELEAQNAALGGKAGGYSDERGPLVAEARLQVASDDGRCAGELHKKGGTRSGLLNRHNWSLRTFWVRTELADGENYELLYFKGGPDYARDAAALRKAAKGSLPLAGCTVVDAADFKARCAAHAAALDAKLARLVEDGEEDGEGGDVSLTDAEIAAAEALHKAHARRIKDADRRFADLVDHAAVNGTVSKMDAALLEVAWIQTTLDPAKIKLF